MNTIHNRASQTHAEAMPSPAVPAPLSGVVMPLERHSALSSQSGEEAAPVALWRPALLLFVLLTVITGLVYPAVVTGLAKAFFPVQAEGSLVRVNGMVVGSTLVGQAFTDPRHFWGRPSATTPQVYNGANSSGSNLGPSNPALLQAVQARVAALRAADPEASGLVPVDLVTASASGLDPDISLAAAHYQVSRVARMRGVPEQQVQAVVDQLAMHPVAGFLGEPRVNVLALNLALDRQWPLR
jgi:potassium-transporting ATPase KdpC subunit